MFTTFPRLPPSSSMALESTSPYARSAASSVSSVYRYSNGASSAASMASMLNDPRFYANVRLPISSASASESMAYAYNQLMNVAAAGSSTTTASSASPYTIQPPAPPPPPPPPLAASAAASSSVENLEKLAALAANANSRNDMKTVAGN